MNRQEAVTYLILALRELSTLRSTAGVSHPKIEANLAAEALLTLGVTREEIIEYLTNHSTVQV